MGGNSSCDSREEQMTAGRASGKPGQKLNSVAMPCKEAAIALRGHWGSTGEL